MEYVREQYEQYFKPTYLYIKQHKVTGLKYFGKTTNDPLRYCGSGAVWKNHINYHGREHVETIWYQLFNDIDECRNYALKFSEDNNIVESKDWANLIVEDGLWLKPETRKKMSEAKLGKPGHRKGAKHSDEAKEKNRQAHLGRKHSEESKRLISQNSRHDQSEETKEKIRNTLTGTKHSEDRINKMRASKLGKTYTKSECPNCKKMIAMQHLNRHKCKDF